MKQDSETPDDQRQPAELNPGQQQAVPRRHFLRAGAAMGAAAFLAACGGAPEVAVPAPTVAGKAASNTTAAAAPTAPAAAATASRAAATTGQKVSGDIGLRYFPFGTGVEDIYADFAKQFQSANPDAKVRLDLQPWDNRYPKMLADLAAGQGPDVVFVTTDVLIRFTGANAIAVAGDLIPEQTWQGYADKTVEEITYNGKRWFIPMDQEVPLVLTNKAIFQKVGLDPEKPPTTWDEIREVCRKVKAADPNVFGWGYAAGSSTLNTTFYPFLYQAGGRPISKDGSEPTFNSDAGVEALSFIVEMFDQGWVSQQWLQPVTPAQDPFNLGKQAMSTQVFAAGLITLRKTAPEIKYGIAPMIKNKEAWGFGGMRSWAISAQSKNKDAAAALVRFLVKPENMARHSEAFGVFPVNKEAATQVYKNDAELAGLKERLPLIFGEQKHKYGRDLMPLVTPEIQAAILKAKTPKQALDDAAAKVRALFAKG
ncbi:MAG: sugar ABC transporter substrate-binding protein [Herpetosiphon sp.]